MRSHLVRLESSGEGFDDPYWPRARWTKYSCAPRVNGKRERCLFRGSLAAAVSWEEIDGELHFGLIYEPHLGVDGSQITVSQIICGGTIIDERSARLRHGPLAQFGFRIDPPQLANLNFSIHKGRELLMEVGLQSEVGVEGGPDVFLNVGKRHYDKVIERIRKAIFEAKSSPQNAHYTPEFAAKLQSSFDKPIPPLTDDLHIDVDVGPYVPATMVPYLVTIVIPDGDPRLDQKAPELPARWYEDPTGRHQLRYWDGGAWTEHVSDDGITGADPLQTG